MSTNSFKKGQLVTLVNPDTKERVSGVLDQSTAKILKIVFESDGKLVAMTSNDRFTPDMLIKHLDIQAHQGTPVSDDIQKRFDALNASPLKVSKGDVVSFVHNKKRCTGRVLKGGKTPMVSYVMSFHMNIPATQLSPATAPVPDQELAEWDVSKMTETGEGRNGPSFRAIVTRHGVDVFEAECRGDGGCLYYHPVKQGSQKDIAEWKEMLNAYVESQGQSNAICDELWPEYAWEMKPTGMTFAKYLTSLSSL